MVHGLVSLYTNHPNDDCKRQIHNYQHDAAEAVAVPLRELVPVGGGGMHVAQQEKSHDGQHEVIGGKGKVPKRGMPKTQRKLENGVRCVIGKVAVQRDLDAQRGVVRVAREVFVVFFEILEKADDSGNAHAHNRERIEREHIRHVGHGVLGAVSHKGDGQKHCRDGDKKQNQQWVWIEHVKSDLFELVFHIVTSERE